jgi:hypothetical protein
VKYEFVAAIEVESAMVGAYDDPGSSLEPGMQICERGVERFDFAAHNTGGRAVAV